MTSPLNGLHEYGQSVWFDFLRRSLITSGELQRLIEVDGIRGLTSNPSIFAGAIAARSEYIDLLDAPEMQSLDAKARYERIAVRDIQDAADRFRPLYEESKGGDGYVSLEVAPQLAHDTQGTLEEARRLWQTVGRENLMIKVPGTAEGIPAFERLTSEGINVNVTLLFAQEAYEQVAAAYLSGLEGRMRQGGDVAKVASVASFFISRIDTAADHWLAERIKASNKPSEQAALKLLVGKVAIANAKKTYQKYLEIVGQDRWQELSRRGARPQRLLWASTGTKNPAYSDVLYVEELIGADTVNTIPPVTLDAFRGHGRLRASLTENVEAAIQTLSQAENVGLPLKQLTDQLLVDGLKLFSDAFDKVLEATGRSE